MKKLSENLSSTQIGLHTVRNVLGEQNQINLFHNHHIEYSEEYGVELSGSISRFGVDLTDMQLRVMEGILHGFSRTGYQGNFTPKSRDEIVEERFGGKIPLAYQNVTELPILRVKQSEILEWAGVNRNSIAAWGRAVDAINSLGTTQFCFYYDRLVYEDGKPVRDKEGGWKKEQVTSVDALFTIKEVREKESGVLKYYEITPSPIFLDQRESYFMMVPFNWREEVRQLYGNKKASGYLFLFLIWLRYQFELKRRSRRVKLPYQIKWSPEDIARAIKMPEGTIKLRKKQMLSVLYDSYSVAQKLGYLTDIEIHEHVHVLTLNTEKYFGSSGEFALDKALKQMSRPETNEKIQAAGELFARFHELRKSLDPQHKIPIGARKSTEELLLMDLLDVRTSSSITDVMSWAVERKFWCSRLSTVARLKQHFDEAFAEMELENRQSSSPQRNKKFIEDILAKCGQTFRYGKIEILSKHVEFCTGTNATCFDYDDKKFQENVEAELKRWGVDITLH